MTQAYLRLLSAEDMQRIHEASLAMLEKTGMLIEHDQARQMLREHGALVDDETQIVRFPESLIEEKLALLPRSVLHAGRDPENDIVIEADGEIYARTAGGSTHYIALDTGEYRRSTLDDWREFLTLADALPNVRACSTMACSGVPEATADLHSLLVLMLSQRNNIVHDAFGVDNLRTMIEMMLVVRGSREALKQRPWLQTLVSPVSPLSLPAVDTEQLFLAGEYGLPTTVPIMPMVGTTSPATLAGTLAQANAEFLGVVCVAQTAHPGHVIPYFVDPVVADMRTGAPLMGAPEVPLLCAAIAQLGYELYGLAPEGIGLDCDTVIDDQIMFEKCSNLVMQVMAGGVLVVGAGLVQACMAASPAQLVIDDEITGYARRWRRGIAVDDDCLALDVIDRVGPRGDFLSEKHTRLHLHTGEVVRPSVFDRDPHAMWVAKGSRSLHQQAREKARAILDSHSFAPLPDDVAVELAAIVDRADQRLGQ
jgi:trimethylamine--corrinoid protein Co-methyltransferase